MTDLILPKPEDAVHKAWLYRVLSGICDHARLARVLYFKGGTCAAMLGYLDRFSVNLDFDYVGSQNDLSKMGHLLEKVFSELGLMIHDQSKAAPQYFLKYEAPANLRNTLKIDVSFPTPRSNVYSARRFDEIDRIITCQTAETMMANKLVALMDRYERRESIAGRDLYDIHHFFLNGLRYREEVIVERTGKVLPKFFSDLSEFIENNITEQIIDQDLNILLPYPRFSRIRKILKTETLMFLGDELKRVRSL